MKENAYVLAAKNILYNYYYEYVPDSIPAAPRRVQGIDRRGRSDLRGVSRSFQIHAGGPASYATESRKKASPDGRGLRLYKKYEANDMMD